MITTRLLQDTDFEVFDRFLEPYTPWLYFMRSNIKCGGMEFQGKPYQAEYFAAWRDGAICGVVSHSWIGSVQCFLPDVAAAEPLAALWAETRQKQPREISCLLGRPQHVFALREALGFTDADFRAHAGVEDLFTLQLDQLQKPDLPNDCLVRLAVLADAETLTDWRHDFYVEALGDAPGEVTRNKACSEVTRRIGEGDLFVLEKAGALVSLCGAGGFLPDWKMIGPVWTPLEQRGKGYARMVVAEALAQLHQQGAEQAVLFTSNPKAAWAYQAIGFVKQGDWRLDFFHEPMLQLPNAVAPDKRRLSDQTARCEQ